MKLNFNPYIYNSMSFFIIKKGEIVGPEAFTLVLMMINSYSYSLLILWYLVSEFNQDISRWLASTKVFWSFHMLIQEFERQDRI